MPRTDIHLDAMLRHLGAAYYESLHGRATRADVVRALDTVEEHLHEHQQRMATVGPASARRTLRGVRKAEETHREHEQRPAGQGDGSRSSRGWARRVGDVMTTSVVTVDRITPYKEIVRLLAEHRISGVPVLKMGREVIGMVTEADLIASEASTRKRLRAADRRAWVPHRRPHPALTAAELMTTPPVTIGADATVPAAARLMAMHHVRRLPVVDVRGKLVGVVSRRDLLSVFLRPDEDIAADIRRVLEDILLTEPGDVEVVVRNGIVTLTGAIRPTSPHDELIPLALRLMWDVDGVVDVEDRLGTASPEQEPAARSGDGAGQPATGLPPADLPDDEQDGGQGQAADGR